MGAAPPDGTEVWCEKDGRRHGQATKWHESGQVFETVGWVDGKKEGLLAAWDEEGRPTEMGQYRADKKVGRWTTFTEGKVQLQGDFEDDEQHGGFVEYAGNGNRQAEGQFRRGEPCGAFRCWNWETGEPSGCVPLEQLCTLTATGADCPPCKE